MIDSTMKRCGAVAVLVVIVFVGACHKDDTQLPSRANFTRAVNDYLAQRGHLCLAKYDWPIVVTAADLQANNLNAQQMTVLEAHGLVKGHVAMVGVQPAHEYALTAEGQKYYLHVPMVINTPTQHVVHPADFCAATLSLGRIIGWEKPMMLEGRVMTSVLFTYEIAPEAWAQAPDVSRVFPVLARAVEDAGTSQLRLGLHLTPDGWIADELSQ